MRRSHKKSRHGCKTCKLRHLKCDETRPSCVNCQTAERRCPYLDSPSPLVPSPSPSGGTSPCPPATLPDLLVSRPAAQPVAPAAPATLVDDDHGRSSSSSPRAQSQTLLLGENYSLLHLELLYHLTSEMGPILYADPREHLTKMVMKEAFRTPYLMDQLLALAAVHLSSTAVGDRKEFYMTEATRLQTRAISHFNAEKPEVSEDNYLAIFVFSAYLGQHALFEAFSTRRDFSTVLDKFIHCLGLHRGVRTVAANSWPRIQTVLKVERIDLRPASAFMPDDCCNCLLEMIDRSDLSQDGKEACLNAVECLQHMFDYHLPNGLSPERRASAFQEWPVRVSIEYVDLLNQRKPEALVILAYYAVLLHYNRGHWAVGDVGSFFICAITTHLGTYWARWLEWPNEVLRKQDASPPDAATSHLKDYDGVR